MNSIIDRLRRGLLYFFSFTFSLGILWGFFKIDLKLRLPKLAAKGCINM